MMEMIVIRQRHRYDWSTGEARMRAQHVPVRQVPMQWPLEDL